jgi:aminoglycoside phosphotransferase (APT) family kinase protein
VGEPDAALDPGPEQDPGPDGAGAALALELVRRRLPSAATGPAERVGAGQDHVVWRVGGLLVRVPRAAPVPGAVAREAQVLRFAARHSPIPVPQVAFVDEVTGALAYPMLPGVPLMDLLVREEDAAPEPLGQRLGLFLRALHTRSARLWAERAGVPVDVQDTGTWLADARECWVPAAAVIPRAAAFGVERFLQAPPPDTPPEDELVLSHNDLGAEHVLVDPSGGDIAGVIDFGDAAIVDPAYDLGLIARDLGPDALSAALGAYGRRHAMRELTARVWFYARCSALEDLAYGVGTRREAYVLKTVRALPWLFGRRSGPGTR